MLGQVSTRVELTKTCELTPTCKCGAKIEIPKGKTKSRCRAEGCGMRWERKSDGYWATGLLTISFTPIFARLDKPKSDHYGKYMEWRNRSKRRGKAGSRC